MRSNKIKKQIIAVSLSVSVVIGIVAFVNWQVSAEINLTDAYFSKSDIPPRTQITEDMIHVREVSSDSLPPNAITEKEDIVGHWTVPGYGLTGNSYFYKSKITKTENMPDAGVLELEEDEVAYPLLVDIKSSIGNSIVPNSYVDLYFKGNYEYEDENGQVVKEPIYGKIADHIRVTAVKDSNAMNVFTADDYTNKEGEEVKSNELTEEQRELAKLYVFAVDEELNSVLNKGEMLGQIVPVSTGEAYEENIESNIMKTKINDMVKWVEKHSYSSDENGKNEEQKDDENIAKGDQE